MTRSTVERRHLAGRLFGILDAFSAERPLLGLSDISRRTGLPVATVHRLVAHLVEWGALERVEDGRYGIGIRLWEVASLGHRTLGLREAGRPPLLELRQRTGATVQLVVLDRADTVVVDQVSGGRPAAGRIGERAPARRSVAGRVLLAHLPTPPAPDDPLRHVLDGIRRHGVDVSDGRAGAFAVAAPVADGGGTVVAALAAAGRAPGRDPRQVVRDVRAAATALSVALAPAAERRPPLVS